MKPPSTCALIKYSAETTADAIRVEARADGKFVGRLEAKRDGDKAFHVGFVTVATGAQRCGVGTHLYELAAKTACAQDAKLGSDTYRTTMSEGFWAKQVAKGRARCAVTADPVVAEQHARDFPTARVSRYGRGGCDRYELINCPVTSLAKPARSRTRSG